MVKKKPSPMSTFEIYIKLTDPTGKSQPVISSHLVWDKAKFLESMRDQYTLKAKSPTDVRLVAEVSQDEYRQANWPNR